MERYLSAAKSNNWKNIRGCKRKAPNEIHRGLNKIKMQSFGNLCMYESQKINKMEEIKEFNKLFFPQFKRIICGLLFTIRYKLLNNKSHLPQMAFVGSLNNHYGCFSCY